MARAGQLAWILDHELDLDADFRVFYRMSLEEAKRRETGPSFFALALRTVAYQGVMAARAYAENETARGGERNSTVDNEVSSTRGAIEASPLGNYIEFGEG